MSLRATTKTFEGVPCPQCQTTRYYVSNRSCVACTKAYGAARYLRQREQQEPPPQCGYLVKCHGKGWRQCEYPGIHNVCGRALCTQHRRYVEQEAARRSKCIDKQKEAVK